MYRKRIAEKDIHILVQTFILDQMGGVDAISAEPRQNEGCADRQDLMEGHILESI
jgi:hypothetical protein